MLKVWILISLTSAFETFTEKLLQLLNGPAPIFVKPLINTFLSELHVLNATYPILVTVSGIDIVFSFQHLRNAPSNISVIPCGIFSYLDLPVYFTNTSTSSRRPICSFNRSLTMSSNTNNKNFELT